MTYGKTMVKSDNSRPFRANTFSIDERQPAIHPEAWVSPTATLIGSVELAQESSVWYGAILRGDDEQISVGARSNIQDGSVLHADPGFPCSIGNDVTIAHNATVHGASVGEGSLIGIGAIILNGATIGKRCLVAAGTLIPEGAKFDDDTLILGSPAIAKRLLRSDEIAYLSETVEEYVANARRHRNIAVSATPS